jgi:vacuole morphology and inheritance protein 14
VFFIYRSSIKFEQDYYNQLIQLVQLIESSVLNNTRMLLLNPLNNIYLVKTLYGILMILPQGKAFGALNKRLKNLEMLIMMDSKTSPQKTIESDKVNIQYYLDEFDRIQALKK